MIFRIHGPFLFGATDKINDIAARIDEMPAVVVLRLRNMTALDATGLYALEEFADAIHASGRGLIFCGALPQPAKLMKRAEFEQHVGAKNICPNVAAALARAEQMFKEMAAAKQAIKSDFVPEAAAAKV
ncbi:MAG: sodium-independent anion transporter [Acidobacteria bacterium]|nr:sodium-independent anion transporter [Acidobacteriota bacterium]